MKRPYYALAGVFLLAFIFFGCTNSNVSKKKEGGILGVADLKSDPASFKETVTVTGVVARVSREEKKLFAIIDTDEAQHCKSTSCAKFYIPVSFDGQTPKEWDEVNVTGRIVEQGGLILQASKLDILRHLTVQ